MLEAIKYDAIIILALLFVGTTSKKKKYEEFSKYQAVDIDISVLINKGEKYSSLERCIKEANIRDLLKYELIDVFENNEKLKDKKSITIRFTLLSKDHTLSSEEINNDLRLLIEKFEEKGFEIKK